MLECKICGTKFNAIVERHYLARVLLLRRISMTPLTARCVVVR